MDFWRFVFDTTKILSKTNLQKSRAALDRVFIALSVYVSVYVVVAVLKWRFNKFLEIVIFWRVFIAVNVSVTFCHADCKQFVHNVHRTRWKFSFFQFAVANFPGLLNSALYDNHCVTAQAWAVWTWEVLINNASSFIIYYFGRKSR